MIQNNGAIKNKDWLISDITRIFSMDSTSISFYIVVWSV